jgi:2-methylcitrate dehydratase PrpD
MDASITPLPLRKKLSDFIHDTSFEKLQPNIIHHAKLCLLDLIGVSLAGGCQKAASIVQRLIPAEIALGKYYYNKMGTKEDF